MTAPLPAEKVEALAEALRASRMVAYEDGKGGHLFRAATPEEQAEALLPLIREREARLVARMEALADSVWRATPCGCGHRADLHTMGAFDMAVCTGGLGLCGCDWSFPRIVAQRIKAALADTDGGAW